MTDKARKPIKEKKYYESRNFCNFIPMKYWGKITSFITLLSLIAFIAASMGFTVISQSCHNSSGESLSTYFLSASEEDSGTCCSTNDCCSDQIQKTVELDDCCSYQDQATSDLNTCCEHENIFVKLTYFIPEVAKVSPPELMVSIANHHKLTFTILKENSFPPFSGLEKYGGRSIITLHCQLII
jgi:hypothetical protein